MFRIPDRGDHRRIRDRRSRRRARGDGGGRDDGRGAARHRRQEHHRSRRTTRSARARARVEAHGMRVLSIASPLLKCVLPDAARRSTSASSRTSSGPTYTFEDQPRLTRRAFEIAEKAGAADHPGVLLLADRRIREHCTTGSASALRELADEALERGIVIGLENEHACNVGTGAEAARMLAAVDHPALKLIWDPANAVDPGRNAVSGGYAALPVGPRSRTSTRRTASCPGTSRRGGRSARWASTGRGRWRLSSATLPGSDQPRDALAGRRRRSAPGQHHLRPQPARARKYVASAFQAEGPSRVLRMSFRL